MANRVSGAVADFYYFCGGVILKQKEKTKSSLSLLMEYAGGYKVFTYLSWILSGISAAFALVSFYFIWKIIKEVLLVIPNFKEATGVTRNGWMAVIFAVLSMLIYVGALMCSHTAAFRVQANLRKTMLHHIVKLPLGVIESMGSGKVRKTVDECSASTETYLAHQLPDMVGAYVTPLGLIVMLFAFDWRFGLFSLIPIALGFIIMMAYMTGPTLKQKMGEYQNALDNMSNEAVEYVRGIPVVKTFGQTVYSFKRFKKSIDDYSTWAIAYTKDLMIPMCVFTTLVNGVFAFILIAGMIFTRGGVTTDLILNILFYIIITPILTVTMTKIMFQSENKMLVEDALKRIDGILSVSPLESENEQMPKDSSIELCGVSYSYDGEKKALNNVSLKIDSGKTVAFVGPSGGGKTTLANIICRFFDPQEGTVKIGGVDVKNIAKDTLMNTVSFVFQNSRVIKASVIDNIKLGNPNATDDEVKDALHRAQCDDIIAKLPNGVETVIGTEGAFLSGGEMQRLAIARTILKNSPIVILDEATAFADPDNEVKVQQAFSEMAKDKTVIMIAHRLSTVADADCIYVIKDGAVAESGTGRELISQHGLFEKMLSDYASSVNWKVAKEEVQ